MKLPVHKSIFLAFVIAIDALIVFDAFAVAYLLRFRLQWAPFFCPPEPVDVYVKATVVVAYFWLILFKVAGLYDFSKTRSAIDTVHAIVKSVSFGTLIILSISYFYREFTFSRLVVVYAWGIATVLFCVFRIALLRLRGAIFTEGIGVRNALLVGSQQLAAFLADRIRSRPELGYRVVGALADATPAASLSCPALGSVDDIEEVIHRERVDRVLIAHPLIEHTQQLRVIATCEKLGVPLSLVPATFDLVVNYRDFEEVDGIPLVSVRERETRALYEMVKRLFDVTVAALSIVVFVPVALVIAWLVRREDGGPALFSQSRIGRDGVPFRMWKFRTMVHDAEERLSDLVRIEQLEEPVFKLDADPRVTRIGQFLRRSSLDELPQLFNVLRGDMSLVGPRPEEAKVVARYGVWEERRLKAKPGMTGLQQVTCRGSKSFRERMRWDVVYVRKRSFLLDLSILLKTVYVVATGRGAH